MSTGDIVEVAAQVFCVTGTEVNWVLVREGADITLIDAGYPGDIAKVETSLRSIGSRPEDVRAILLTHAHIDHIGAVNHFHTRYGTPVYTSATETAHARREYLEQAAPLDVIKNSWRPGMLRWSLRILRAGALSHESIPHAEAFPNSGALDLPGHPQPIATSGHTSGHVAYYMPSVGAVAIGDGLATGHPTSRLVGAQILPSMFNHCTSGEAVAALEVLTGLDAGVVIPGHGAPLHASVEDAVAAAKDSIANPSYW
jgi:glyoxylase-like metal-dependent hydrolase (beta-lactamase superfamily II)